MELKKSETQILKTHAEILEPMLTRRINELKERLFRTEKEDSDKVRGRALELAEWRGIIKDLINPKPTKKPDSGV